MIAARTPRRACFCLLVVGAAAAAPLLPAQDRSLDRPTLSSSLDGAADPVSTDGTLDLSWSVGEACRTAAAAGTVRFEIEEVIVDGDTERLAAGPHLAAALSGRDDGRYRYRVRALGNDGEAGPWSEPVSVRVAHHPLWLACLLFGIGAVVFVATTVLILTGHRRAHQPSPR